MNIFTENKFNPNMRVNSNFHLRMKVKTTQTGFTMKDSEE